MRLKKKAKRKQTTAEAAQKSGRQRSTKSTRKQEENRK